MEDSEKDTFVPKNKNEQFCEILQHIGIKAEALKIDTDDSEKGDYYSRELSNTPAMVTNHGCIKIENSNIDVVQIIQRG